MDIKKSDVNKKAWLKESSDQPRELVKIVAVNVEHHAIMFESANHPFSDGLGECDFNQVESIINILDIEKLTADDVVRLIFETKMHKPDKGDLQAFSGINDPENALIGYPEYSNEITLIVDGTEIEIIDGDSDFVLFSILRPMKLRKIN